MGLCGYISQFSSLDYLGIMYTNGQSNIILFADRINKSLKRPLPFFILKVDQSPIRGLPESRNAGFRRPDSFMPTHGATTEAPPMVLAWLLNHSHKHVIFRTTVFGVIHNHVIRDGGN